MERTKLISLLSDVEPALAASSMVPILSHFCFTGKVVYGWDDNISISVPCKTDFKGAVPRTLLALLKTSGAKELELLEEKDNLVVKAASAKFKFATMAPEDFIHDLPKAPATEFPVDAGRFLQAMESCMFSVGNDTSASDYMGITMIKDGDELLLFATDRATISMGAVPLKGKSGFKGRVVLPTNFCKQLMRLCAGAKKLNMEITDEHAIVECEGTILFGKIVEPDKPLDFIEQLGMMYDDKTRKSLIQIPTKLSGILERACIVMDGAVDKSTTSMTLKDGKAWFTSKSEKGEVLDKLQLDKHPNSEARIDAKRIRDGISRFDRMFIGPQACVLTNEKGPELVYLVSTSEG